MKNIILALSGCLMLVFLTLSTLSVYRLTICRKELTDVVSAAVYSVLCEYCQGQETDQEAEDLISERIRSGLTQLTEPEIIIYACSMEMGIVSVEVRGSLVMPAGTEKTVVCRRTAIWDRKSS